MDPIAGITQALELFEKLGFPLWSGVVLWAAIKINHTVHDGLSDLRQRDENLQRALEQHIAKSDTRIALIEQLLRRHDDNIESLWTRISENGKR